MSNAWTSLTWSQNKQKFQVWDGRDRWYLYIKWLPRPGLPAPATVRQTAGKLLMKFKTFLVSWVKTECWWWGRGGAGAEGECWRAGSSMTSISVISPMLDKVVPFYSRKTWAICLLCSGQPPGHVRHDRHRDLRQPPGGARSKQEEAWQGAVRGCCVSSSRNCEIFANLRLKL